METLWLPPPSDKVLPEDRCCTPVHHFLAAQVGAQQEEVGLGHIQRAGSLALREIFHALFPPRRDWEYWSPTDAQEKQGDEDTGKCCSLYQPEAVGGPSTLILVLGPLRPEQQGEAALLALLPYSNQAPVLLHMLMATT